MVLSAPAGPAIIGFARDDASDLIVMASHGRTGFRRLVLGSVTEEVIRAATCPVLVVRHAAAPHGRDEERGMPA